MTFSKFADDSKLGGVAEFDFWKTQMNQKLIVYLLSHILMI